MFGCKTRKIALYEKLQAKSGCYTQLTLKVKHRHVKEIVGEIAEKAIGCRTKLCGDYYEFNNDNCPVFNIPDNFPHIDKAAKYAAKYHTVPESQSLASICYNEDTVILNSNNAVSDAGYMKLLTSYLSGYDVPKDRLDHIPSPPLDALSKQLKNIHGHVERGSMKIIPRNLKFNNQNINAFNKFIEIPFDRINALRSGKSKDLSTRLMCAQILVASAFNRRFTEAKIMNIIDARRYLEKQDWSIANLQTSIQVNANDLSSNSSIFEMNELLKKDLKKKLDDGTVLKAFKDACECYNKPINYPTCELSHIGSVKTGLDVKDCLISTSFKPPVSPQMISLTSMSVNDELFRGRMFFAPRISNEKDAYKYTKAINYCITELNEELSIKEVIEDLKQRFSL